MKILMLKAYYPPETAASLYLTADMVEAFANNEMQVKVYTPTPCRGVTEEQRKLYSSTKKREVLNNGFVTVHRFSMFPEKRNALLRAFRYTLCLCAQFFHAFFERDVDALLMASTPPINGLLMALLKKRLKCKTVYNLQDIFPDSLVHTGMTRKGSLLWKIGRWVENITYRAADKIIVISEGFKQNIMAKGVPEEKIVVVPNWVDENAVVSVDQKDNPLFDKYSLDRTKFYVCYSGNIGFTQNMEELCQVAKKLEKYENIGIIIVGDGAFKPQLEKIIAEQKINNITLIPFQDYSEISNVFSLGDVGLIISKRGVGTNSVPSKTWSIMSAERPVLASFDEDSELCQIVAETSCGVCVPPDDSESLKNAILYLYKDREGNVKMGKNGRKYILENLTKAIGTQKYIDVLKNVIVSNN